MTGTTPFKPSEGFKGLWIPISILIDPELPPIQKLLLAEIWQLQQNASGECFAGNDHFCAITGCKERNLRNHLSALVDKGMLSPYEPSKRRRLYVSESVERAIESESQTPVSIHMRQGNAASAIQSDTTSANIRQNATAVGGKTRKDPAPGYRQTRHQNATEHTSREQGRRTKQNTTVGGYVSVSENDFADTYLRDSEGKPIARMASWKAWLNHCDFEAVGISAEKQSRMLAAMVKDGFNGDDVLLHPIERGWDEFWVPGGRIIPDGLEPKYCGTRWWEKI